MEHAGATKPTWQAAVPIIIAGIKSDSEFAQKAAMEALRTMAIAADRDWSALQK